MFTLEHLRFRRVSGAIKPHFVNPADRSLLAEAEAAVLVCRTAADRGASRAETADQLAGGDRVATALCALLMKRLDFTAAADIDYPAMRTELFARSAELLTGELLSAEEYRKKLSLPDRDIYGDLPDDELCIGFRELSPSALLYHYNLNQVQTLLAFAEKLEFTLPDPPKAKLRNFFKQLRFNRLVAEFSGGEVLTVTVSGPLALFSETRKYAMALGNFFPAVLAFDNWKLRADITPPRGGPGELVLDQSSPLSPVGRRHWSVYEPEEFKMFRELFIRKCGEFELLEDAGFIQLGPGEAMFPDFAFRGADGGTYVLELFHRHHSRELERRIAWIKAAGLRPGYLAGVDRALLSQCDAAREMCDAGHPNLFAFREFPGVARVASFLSKLSELRGL